MTYTHQQSLHASITSTTHIVRQFLDASRESSWVCLQAALGIALVGGPAVIDADVLVTGLFPALLRHHIRHLHVQTLAARATGGDRRGRQYQFRCQCSMSCAGVIWQTQLRAILMMPVFLLCILYIVASDITQSLSSQQATFCWTAHLRRKKSLLSKGRELSFIF